MFGNPTLHSAEFITFVNLLFLKFQNYLFHSSQEAEHDIPTFLVGTQSMKDDNAVHMFELSEETGDLTATSYLHPTGEIWNITSSPQHRHLIATCHSHVEDGVNLVSGATVWRLGSEEVILERVGDLSAHKAPVRGTEWGGEGYEGLLCSLGDNSLIRWEVGSEIREVGSCELPKRASPTSLRWNPHNGYQVGVALDTHVRLYDLRAMKCSTVIEQAHTQTVRDLDYNPNKQYTLVTCGDDCETRFWDTRNTGSPLLSFNTHSHWVWKVRYNLRDQLLLTGGSDSKVVLLNVSSLASESLSDGEEEEGEKEQKVVMEEGVLEEFDEHEDSVYSVAWSTVDPWLFASLSNDGRLVLNKVSKEIKFNIIL